MGCVLLVSFGSHESRQFSVEELMALYTRYVETGPSCCEGLGLATICRCTIPNSCLLSGGQWVGCFSLWKMCILLTRTFFGQIKRGCDTHVEHECVHCEGMFLCH